jgi:catechol 2,3-dioxygenase-like lactoylglutathione lyase family enzyme
MWIRSGATTASVSAFRLEGGQSGVEVKGIVWISSRTPRFGEMREFVSDVLGLEPYYDEGEFALFSFQNGHTFEVTGPGSPVFEDPELDSHPDGRGPAPIAAFQVDDVDSARAEMEEKGVRFIGPVHSDPSSGNRWAHFIAPDGYVYEICRVAKLA